ncbi:MAG: hypothetical protein NC429_04845 [Lachnospiraceae bacterium]|nr:hypothetical protein [Lachnospiraceae bacterium]
MFKNKTAGLKSAGKEINGGIMRKRISKLKRALLKRETGKRFVGLMLLIALLSASAGTIMPVHGEELHPRTVVTEIYHKHIGNPNEKGGCYQQEIPHIHQGSEQEGGSCYQNQIEHVHQGDEASGTGCYSKVIYHTHAGDGQSEEGCYKAVYHIHEESCYKNKICTIRYTKGEVIGTEMKECIAHGQALHEKAEGVGTHVNCSIGEEDVHLEYCKECGIMTYSYHDYQELACGKSTEAAEEYVPACGKDETTAEGYETGCGLEQGSVERYELSCSQKVEGYARNCELDEKTPLGKMIVTNETEGNSEKVTLSVRIEDLSGGKLLPEEPPFIWRDETGKQIGSGEQIEVDKNGNYTVEVRLRNRDVDEDSLKSGITIDNVLLKENASPSPEDQKSPSPAVSETPDSGKPSPEASPTPDSGDPTPTANPSSTEEPSSTKEPSSTEEPSPAEEPSSAEDPEPTQEPSEGEILPQKTPSPQPVLPADNGEAGSVGGGEHRALEVKKADGSGGQAPSAAPQSKGQKQNPEIKKETEKKEIEKNMTQPSETVEVKNLSFWQRVFANPKVKIFSIAAGVLILLSGLFFLLLYLLKSVRVYNDDGQGRFVRLGRARVCREEEGYTVTISEQMEEKAYTNRYCIKPGLFRLGKNQQEILVYKDTKRVSVELNREMIFII